MLELSVVSVTVRPPGGAGFVRLTGTPSTSSMPISGILPMLMSASVTRTSAVAVSASGDVPVSVVTPTDTPATVNVPTD
jgi:hypothetical protein